MKKRRHLFCGILFVALAQQPVFSQQQPPQQQGANVGGFVAGIGFDMAGWWGAVMHEDQLERGPGPDLVDFGGFPINDAARTFALAWDSSRITAPEHQCQSHTVQYIYWGPLQLHIWEERDPQSQALIAIKQYLSTFEQHRTIWMDGRQHPPEYAPHTFQGFSTGVWEGNMLTVRTTHIKQGWYRRNGLIQSDKATLVEHYIRHGEYLTQVSITTDPVYLTEPYVRTTTLHFNGQQGQNLIYPCDYVVEIAGRAPDNVPNYMPGENPFLTEFATKYKLPAAAVLGGAETMYPEYMAKMKQMAAR